MDDSKEVELSDKSFSIKKKDESLISSKSKNDKNDGCKNSKEIKNLNERIIKLFIGNHPLLSIKSIKNLVHLHFLNKYAKPESYYNSIIIDHIIHNEPGHIVAEFKDFLILGDINEFLQNYYKAKESKYILPKIFEYYINCSVIFPNYVVLPESQYIYKNIQKKQKVIDIQQEQEDKEEKIKKGEMKQEKKEDVFTTQILDSILNQTDTSGIRQYFGVSNDGNSMGDHLSKIIDGIQFYENNKISDLKPKNHLYKNYEKINLNNSFFKNKIEEQVINGSNKKNENTINENKIKEKAKNEKDIKNSNQIEPELNNNNNSKLNKKPILVLNKNKINNIIDLSNSIKNINDICLNNSSNRSNQNNGFSLKNMISKKQNNSKNKDEIKNNKKKGRNCYGNLIQDNNNFYTAIGDNGGFNNLVNSTSNSKCNTSRHINKKKKIVNNSKKINHKKIIHKNRNVCSSELNIFQSKVIKKSLINSLLNSDKALEISNKDIKNTNDRGTLTNNKENTKTSLNTNYYGNSNNRNKSKKNKIAIRNINVNHNINNESEYLYYRNKNNLLLSGLTKNDKNIVYQRKKNSDISSYYNKNKLSNSIKNIKIGFKTKNYSSNNILEYKNNLSTSNFSSKMRSKNKDNFKLINFKKKGNDPHNNKNKISKYFNVRSNELINSKKVININDDISNGNNKVISTENEGDKIIFKKENTFRNNKDFIKINSYKYKNISSSTFKINNSNSKLNTARFINLDKKMEKKSSGKSLRNNCILSSPKNLKSKKLLLKSDLREKIMNDDSKRPLTMRESLNKKSMNNKVIEVLTNKINQIKEYIKESDKKNKNSISHIFRKKRVGRKKILKDNDEITGIKYGLTEREGNKSINNKFNLNNEISEQKKKKIKIEQSTKSNKKIIKKDKIQIKNDDKNNKSSNSKSKKINKNIDINNKIKGIRNKNINNNGNNYFSDINYNINLNNCHIHTKNKSEFYQNTNINNNDNYSINNNAELGKENKSIILINNNVKIGSLKVFPIKQLNQNKIIVKGIKINGFEKLVSKKYTTRNIDIPKAATDRFKNINGLISQNSSNKYINTSNNNRKQLAKNKINGTNFFKNI